MDERTAAVDLAERVAQIARGLEIETVLIGAYALAVHHFVRGSSDIDLASSVNVQELYLLRRAATDAGYQTDWTSPEDGDPLGDVLRIWEREDEDGIPIDPVEVVNYLNPYTPQRTPAAQAIRNAIPLAEKPDLKYPRLSDLIALKLYSGGDDDASDVVKLIAANPDADLEEIRSVCKAYGFDRIDELIEKGRTQKPRRKG